MFFVHILQGLKAAWDAFPIFRKLWSKFHEALSFLIVITMFWAGLNIVRERDIVGGLQVAFTTSTLQASQRELDVKASLLQAELRAAAVANKAINSIMTAVLDNSPGATRVRFGFIHNGVVGITNVGLLRFDILDGVVKTGRVVGDLLQNIPLSQWDDYIHELLLNKCQLVVVETMNNSASKARLESFGAKDFITCPVIDSRNQMLGALFVTWEEEAAVPKGAALTKTMEDIYRASSQIAGALETQTAASRP